MHCVNLKMFKYFLFYINLYTEVMNKRTLRREKKAKLYNKINNITPISFFIDKNIKLLKFYSKQFKDYRKTSIN
jgi:hypothetical protein